MSKSKFPFVQRNIYKLLIVSYIFGLLIWEHLNILLKTKLRYFSTALILTQSRGQFTAGIAAVESGFSFVSF